MPLSGTLHLRIYMRVYVCVYACVKYSTMELPFRPCHLQLLPLNSFVGYVPFMYTNVCVCVCVCNMRLCISLAFITSSSPETPLSDTLHLVCMRVCMRVCNILLWSSLADPVTCTYYRVANTHRIYQVADHFSQKSHSI